MRLLTQDGRCKWLEKTMINELIPQMSASAQDDSVKTKYMIEDWVTNDNGRVGGDMKWMRDQGVPLVKTYQDVPDGAIVVNTGYDSIVHEEPLLKERGIEVIDKPCPFVRKVRQEFENIKPEYQYVLLCEPNHIIIKNYKSLYPEDMILVQMHNYKERIQEQQNGKPLYLVPYVTFLPEQVQEIMGFITECYPERENILVKLNCMWVSGKLSPIEEINNLTEEDLQGIHDALIITPANSTNKSLASMMLSVEKKGLNKVLIPNLDAYKEYEAAHQDDKVLIVRTPIPNVGEEPIMNYIHGKGKAA